MKIYMAGKVSKSGWRHNLVPDLRGVGPRTAEDESMESWPESVELSGILSPFGTSWQYVGPFFVSCDHGCSHGPRQHGMTAGGCIERGIARKEITRRCLAAIDRADSVFAWIDDPSAHGTLVEIGYALARDKPVHVYLDSAKREALRELWFPAVAVTKYRWASSHVTAWNDFTGHNFGDEWDI